MWEKKRINHRNKYWQISKQSQTQIQWLILNLELQNRKDSSQPLELVISQVESGKKMGKALKRVFPIRMHN